MPTEKFDSDSMKLGRKMGKNDAWIAALGRQHTMPILSRDRHFDLIKGLKRLDW